MAKQWVRYINNFDILIEEALKICCRNSLQSVYEALHGDGVMGPNCVLKIEANLNSNRVSRYIIIVDRLDEFPSRATQI